MIERNVVLFDRIADIVEEVPSAYDQTTYARPSAGRYGVAGCIAGLALVAEADLHGSYQVKRMGIDHSGYQQIHFIRPANRWSLSAADIDFEAKHLLGLTHEECLRLFDSGWEPHDPQESVPQALRRIGRGGRI